jgi:hypothetical protein
MSGTKNVKWKFEETEEANAGIHPTRGNLQRVKILLDFCHYCYLFKKVPLEL